ncbi:hypothetical protein BH24ACT4_BH24ACT4_12160 [soil metagenome]
MTRLLRASTLIGRPVVTLQGESPLEVKDVVFDTNAGDILGFTLRNHGFLGGPVPKDLPWKDVHGLGPDAVVIADASLLTTDHEFSAIGGDVIGDRVLNKGGTELGEVVDVIVSSGAGADVVGFEISPAEGFRAGGDHNVFIPLPDTIAISGENIIVPDDATDYVRDDLTGFGGAVDDFRAQLGGSS